MVSLGSNRRNARGGYFFNTDTTDFEDFDDTSLTCSVLITDNEPRYKTFSLGGWAVVCIQSIAIIAVIASPFLIIYLSPTPEFYLYVTHVGLWCVLSITSFLLNHYHNMFKRYGYLEFHRKTQALSKIPFIVLSCGNASLLLFSMLLQKYCPDSEACPYHSHMRDVHYSLLIYSLEFLVLSVLCTKYLITVIRFCRSKSVPDVHQDELLIGCIHSHSPTNEIGFKEEDFRDEIFERQADMIRYLKQHNIHLSRKVLKLTSELNSFRLSTENA